MCDTTPATVNGIAFSHPIRCENRVRLVFYFLYEHVTYHYFMQSWIYGTVGMFEYPDMSCGWNLMGNISDVEQPPVNTL